MEWINIHKEALNYFQQYLKVDTSNPPGNEIEGALFLKSIFDKENIENRIYETAPKRGNIIAKIEGNKKENPLYLLNHIDVVPVDREKWEFDPFGGEIKNGYIYGRGAQDMKNMAIIQLMAMILLKREKINLNRDLYFIATADEERESNYGIIKLIEKIPELTNPGYVINEGGGGTTGVLSNDAKIIWGIGIGEKKPLFLHLEVYGISGHGSQPDKNNPNEILITALNRIINYKQKEKTHFVVDEMIGRLGHIPDNKFANAIRRNTITLTTLKAGVGDPPKENVIPSISTASIDCRLLLGIDPYEFIENLKNLINDDRVIIKPTKIPKEVPTSSHNTELFNIISEVINRKFPESIVVPIIVPYATDSRYLRDRGFICYGFTPTITTIEDLSLMHSDNEKIAVEEFFKGIELLFDIILEFCGKN
jgi:acetylornithine deacetylase/succinyl-diaminopimelate desuccinylase-like protein